MVPGGLLGSVTNQKEPGKSAFESQLILQQTPQRSAPSAESEGVVVCKPPDPLQLTF